MYIEIRFIYASGGWKVHTIWHGASWGPWLHHNVIDKREHVEEAHAVQENTEARDRSGASLAFLKQPALTVTKPVLLKHFISLSLEVIHRYCLTMNLSVIYFHH